MTEECNCEQALALKGIVERAESYRRGAEREIAALRARIAELEDMVECSTCAKQELERNAAIARAEKAEAERVKRFRRYVEVRIADEIRALANGKDGDG